MEPVRKELGELTVLAIAITGVALGIILAALSGIHHYTSVPAGSLVVCSLIVGLSVGAARRWNNRWSQLVVLVMSMVWGFIFAPMLF